MLKKFFVSSLLMLSFFILFGTFLPDHLFADDGRYLDFCMKKDTASTFYQDLLHLQEQDDLSSLWNDLWKPADQKTRAVRAVSMIDQLIPGGDLSKISMLEGLIECPGNDEGPVIVPQQVAVMEAALMAIPALIGMNEPPSLWLAQSIFQELQDVAEIKLAMETMDAQQYLELNALMSQSRELYRLYQGEIEFTFFETALFDIVEAGRGIKSSSKNRAIPLDEDGKISFKNARYGWQWTSGKIVKWDSVSDSLPEGADEGKTNSGGGCGG